MLTLVKKTKRQQNDGCFIYICRCFCGKLTEVSSTSYNTNKTRSCGCLIGKAGKHHQTKHPMFARYKAMLRRCYDVKCVEYKNYGARGIRVCARWRKPLPEGLNNMMKDLGECPEGYSLERIDVNGDYKPSNCKWATRKEQAANKRNNRWVIINGKGKILSEWAKLFNCSGYRVLKAVKQFGDDYKKISAYCRSKIYINNNTGHQYIHYSRQINRYVVTFVKSGVKTTKKFKTLKESIEFRDKELNQ